MQCADGKKQIESKATREQLYYMSGINLNHKKYKKYFTRKRSPDTANPFILYDYKND